MPFNILPSISRIFVANVARDPSAEYKLRELFEEYGRVIDVVIMKTKDGWTSRGFGFVIMTSDAEEAAAVAALNGAEFMGKT